MSAKKTGLGRGLSALLESSEAANFRNNQQIENTENPDFSIIRLEQIVANPFQPRTEFEAEPLKELADSIKSLGIIQPITVRMVAPGQYQLISGERRFRASKIAGLKQIPAYIRDTEDDKMLQLALVENIQRENLNAIDVAISYERLLDECSLNQEALSVVVGKNRTTIANYLRLLKLPPEIQLGLKLNKISMGHARSLINISNEEKQLALFEKVIEQDLSVRKTEELVRNIDINKPETKVKSVITDKQTIVKKHITERLGTKIDIKRNSNGKGSITISFKSDEHFNQIIQTLNLD